LLLRCWGSAVALLLCTCRLAWSAELVPSDTHEPLLTNAAQVLAAGLASPETARNIRLEGIVLWTNSTGNQFLFQDDSGALPVEVDFRNEPKVQPGTRVRLTGKALATSGTL